MQRPHNVVVPSAFTGHPTASLTTRHGTGNINQAALIPTRRNPTTVKLATLFLDDIYGLREFLTSEPIPKISDRITGRLSICIYIRARSGASDFVIQALSRPSRRTSVRINIRICGRTGDTVVQPSGGANSRTCVSVHVRISRSRPPLIEKTGCSTSRGGSIRIHIRISGSAAPLVHKEVHTTISRSCVRVHNKRARLFLIEPVQQEIDTLIGRASVCVSLNTEHIRHAVNFFCKFLSFLLRSIL